MPMPACTSRSRGVSTRFDHAMRPIASTGWPSGSVISSRMRRPGDERLGGLHVGAAARHVGAGLLRRAEEGRPVHGSRSGSIVEMRTGMLAAIRRWRRRSLVVVGRHVIPSWRAQLIGNWAGRGLECRAAAGARAVTPPPRGPPSPQAEALGGRKDPGLRRPVRTAAARGVIRMARDLTVKSWTELQFSAEQRELARDRRARVAARARDRLAHDPARAHRRAASDGAALGPRPGAELRRARLLARRRAAPAARVREVGLPLLRAPRPREVDLHPPRRGRVRGLEPAGRSSGRGAAARRRDHARAVPRGEATPTRRPRSSAGSWSSAASSRRASCGRA